jgi:23S rRNA pseudouridine1911/1915/1917 synthase
MDILYEDNHLIALNKKPSEIVQGDKTGDIPLSEHLKEYLKKKYNKPGEVFLGVIHRLDRPVSGVVIFARTSKALTRMNDLFRENKVSKVYWAIVQKRPPLEEEILEHFLRKDEKKNKSFAYPTEVRDSRLARMRYRLVAGSDNYSLLEVELFTGRHHQIRCQLSKIGSPVKGDLKYGFSRSNPDGSISLHARKITFMHPVKNEEITIIAPPPEDNLWRALTAGLA